MLKTRTCEWIEHRHNECNQPVIRQSAYCEEHYVRAYQSGTALRKRKKDIRVANKIHDMRSIINEIAETL